MAYFSNSSDGYSFDEQCCACVFGEEGCPIWFVQMIYNYDACNIPVAREILDELVKDDGTCMMFKMASKTEHPLKREDDHA